MVELSQVALVLVVWNDIMAKDEDNNKNNDNDDYGAGNDDDNDDDIICKQQTHGRISQWQGSNTFIVKMYQGVNL